jgi:hypothetical protein
MMVLIDTPVWSLALRRRAAEHAGRQPAALAESQAAQWTFLFVPRPIGATGRSSL